MAARHQQSSQQSHLSCWVEPCSSWLRGMPALHLLVLLPAWSCSTSLAERSKYIPSVPLGRIRKDKDRIIQGRAGGLTISSHWWTATATCVPSGLVNTSTSPGTALSGLKTTNRESSVFIFFNKNKKITFQMLPISQVIVTDNLMD